MKNHILKMTQSQLLHLVKKINCSIFIRYPIFNMAVVEVSEQTTSTVTTVCMKFSTFRYSASASHITGFAQSSSNVCALFVADVILSKSLP